MNTLKELRGVIDVYLPDFKYAFNKLGQEYSKVENYFNIASEAILEMFNQVSHPEFDDKGMIKKGIIIRHLVLPGEIENSKKVLQWIKNNIGKEAYISIMAQYFPTYKAKEIKKINRKITKKEFEEVESYLYELGFENGYIQELGENEEEYVPDFKGNLKNI